MKGFLDVHSEPAEKSDSEGKGPEMAVTHNLLLRDPGNPICAQLDCSGPRWHSDF